MGRGHQLLLLPNGNPLKFVNMDLRFYLALIVGKISAFVLKLKGSGATAAPGLYALSFDPNFVKKFSKQITNGSIIICGTNGKTTTSRIISARAE